MVKINRIYTRTGDDGTTGLVGGVRIAKDSARVESIGAIDELNSYLGIIRTLADAESLLSSNQEETVPLASSKRLSEIIAALQQQLFDLGAELATPKGAEWPTMKLFHNQDVQMLENLIDEASIGVPELRSFVLPGGTLSNAYLHLARTVCRRAERELIRFSREESVSSDILKYVNRLSDLLFALARRSARISTTGDLEEYLWVPAKN